ncbi:MAG: hypothetical protein E7B59_14495 [Enterobacteriaceae bacterium]|nr:hypothetical protein [Enterobacteriaceae bacterium]
MQLEILLTVTNKHVTLIYGEWHAAEQKCRGLVCKVRRIKGLFIRCHPHTGVPLSVHTSLGDLKEKLISQS